LDIMSNTSSIFQPNAHLHVSVYYVDHLQGESPNTCTKPSALYSVALYVVCVIGYKTYTFVEVLTIIETIFCSLVCMLKPLKMYL
jgi:hypothetical protein